MVKVSTPVDYAAHELQVKRMLKEANILLLDKEYAKAADVLDVAIAELRLMRTAVKSYVE
jgi:hypothetical protein